MRLISDLIRFLITFLSFPSNLKKEKLTDTQRQLIEELQIKAKLLIKSDHKFKKMITHQIFSNSVLSMILSGKLENYLRKNFIQKMFFVHNRFYNCL